MTKFETEKRKPGRPPSDEKMVQVLAGFPADLLTEIDKRAEAEFESRPAAIRRLVRRGLKVRS
jgi:metal-responsive CopG/Arc/MetJ family transcriptional regulator